MNTINIRTILLCGSALFLVGCSGASNPLSLSKRAPDEFMVVSNPPLYVPPNFDLTDPNKPSAKLIKADKAGLSGSEKSFLQGLEQPDSATVEEEEAPKSATRKFFSKLSNKSAAEVIDPAAEKDRIAKNKAEGKAINEGKIHTRKEGGSTIDKILGRDEQD